MHFIPRISKVPEARPHCLLRIVLTVTVAVLISSNAYSLPAGYTTVSGEASFDESNSNTLLVTASDRAIVEFDTFSIAPHEMVRFIQPHQDASVLSRVTGSLATNIYGSLFSNGEFVLVNPRGIHVHSSANVQTGALIFSTLEIQNALYQGGDYKFAKASGAPSGFIFNEASITVSPEGHIALLSEVIRNTGELKAPLGKVALGSGEAVTLGLSPHGLISLIIDKPLQNQVLDAEGNPVQDQIHLAGLIEAKGGEVVLKAEALDELFLNAVNIRGHIFADQAVQGPDGTVEIVAGGSVAIGQNASFETENIHIELTGDWSNEGAALPANLTVDIVGEGDSRIMGENFFYHLTIQKPGQTVYFDSNHSQTIQGTLTLEGEYGNLLRLEPSSSGSTWKMDPQGDRNLDYLDVHGSVNLSSEPLSPLHTKNSLNNAGWDFSLAGPVWLGLESAAWSNPANWDGGFSPGVGDTARFTAQSSEDSVVDESSGGSIRSLRVEEGYTGNITLGSVRVFLLPGA